MIVQNNSMVAGWLRVILPLVVIIVFLAVPAYCQADDTIALMVQQSPPDGGTVTPAAGIHSFAPNAEVALTAIPKPGYQFVYWLGDVSDFTSNRTITYLNTPKIIIAVFVRNEYEFLYGDEPIRSAPIGGLFASAPDFGNRGGGGAIIGRQPSGPTPPRENHNLPVPEPTPEFPVPEPVPEPTTGVLLVVGSLLTSVVRRKKG